MSYPITDITNEWHLVLKDGTDINFYSTGEDFVTNPLEVEPDFDCGDCWSIDACDNEELVGRFAVDPEDDSFVLIPKDQVESVYFDKGSMTYYHGTAMSAADLFK